MRVCDPSRRLGALVTSSREVSRSQVNGVARLAITYVSVAFGFYNIYEVRVR